MFMGDGREAGLGLGDQDRGGSAEARQTTECKERREQEDEEMRGCGESAAARQAAERESAAAR